MCFATITLCGFHGFRSWNYWCWFTMGLLFCNLTPTVVGILLRTLNDRSCKVFFGVFLIAYASQFLFERLSNQKGKCLPVPQNNYRNNSQIKHWINFHWGTWYWSSIDWSSSVFTCIPNGWSVTWAMPSHKVSDDQMELRLRSPGASAVSAIDLAFSKHNW